RVAAVLERLGLGGLGLARIMSSLSGGEATRVVLASLLLRGADLVVLDEPTNNLDREARQGLYAAVRDWPGGLLVISHDRELPGLMDRVAEWGPHGLRLYGGNYAFYAEQRQLEEEAARRGLADAEKSLRKERREAQATRERQERRNSRGRKDRGRIGQPTVMLNKDREASVRATARPA